MPSESVNRSRIYFDNAATSWPKPDSVYTAMDRYARAIGAAPGRGGYASAREAAQIVNDCRRLIASLIHAENEAQVVFSANATDAIGMAIRGWLRPGDRVVTTVFEHNSVLRPLRELEQTDSIQVDVIGLDADGRLSLSQLDKALASPTRMLIINGTSNVTGQSQPLDRIAEIAERRSVPWLLDAAQMVGISQVDARSLKPSWIAAAGHKHLLGPLGTGFLYVSPRVADEMRSIKQGGTGVRSEETLHPREMPIKFEAGNLNASGIAGLKAGIEFVNEIGSEAIAAKIGRLCHRLREGLTQIPAIKLHGQPPAENASLSHLISLTAEGFAPEELTTILDQSFRIEVRAGLHCAPLIHPYLGTENSGTVRISPGWFNTCEQIDLLIEAFQAILGQ